MKIDLRVRAEHHPGAVEHIDRTIGLDRSEDLRGRRPARRIKQAGRGIDAADDAIDRDPIAIALLVEGERRIAADIEAVPREQRARLRLVDSDVDRRAVLRLGGLGRALPDVEPGGILRRRDWARDRNQPARAKPVAHALRRRLGSSARCGIGLRYESRRLRHPRLIALVAGHDLAHRRRNRGDRVGDRRRARPDIVRNAKRGAHRGELRICRGRSQHHRQRGAARPLEKRQAQRAPRHHVPGTPYVHKLPHRAKIAILTNLLTVTPMELLFQSRVIDVTARLWPAPQNSAERSIWNTSIASGRPVISFALIQRPVSETPSNSPRVPAMV